MSKLLKDFLAAHSWHFQIEEHEVEGLLGNRRQGFWSVLRRDDVKAFRG